MNKQLPEKDNKAEVLNTMKRKGVMLDSINMMAEKRKKRKKIRTMNARERRKRGIFKISKDNQRCIGLKRCRIVANLTPKMSHSPSQFDEMKSVGNEMHGVVIGTTCSCHCMKCGNNI